MKFLFIIALLFTTPALAQSDKTDYGENLTLDSILDGTLYIALFETAPTDSTLGTEIDDSGYSRQSTTFDDASGGKAANAGSVTFSATGAWQEVTHLCVMDAATDGNAIYCSAVNTPFTLADTESETFDAGTIECEED